MTYAAEALAAIDKCGSDVYDFGNLYTWSCTMRTNVDIDDKLMKAAMKATGKKTKKETIEAALELAIKIQAQSGLRALRGKVKWEGDLDEMRRD